MNPSECISVYEAYMSKGPRCYSCGGPGCPAAGKDYVDDCPSWQEAMARNARGEYLQIGVAQ